VLYLWTAGDLHPVFFTLPVLAENMVFTALTLGRLVYHQRHLKELLGPDYVSHYTSIIIMVVESAGLNVIFQILTIIFAATSSDPDFQPNFGTLVFDITLLGQIQASGRYIISINVLANTYRK
jgi:hypothetical protein